MNSELHYLKTNKYSDIEIRYRRKIFLQDDLGNQYALFFNQETAQEIMKLIGRFKFHSISNKGEQTSSYPLTVRGKVYKVIRCPKIQIFDLWKFYQFGLERQKDWLMITKEQFIEIAPKERKKLIKRKKKR